MHNIVQSEKKSKRCKTDWCTVN